MEDSISFYFQSYIRVMLETSMFLRVDDPFTSLVTFEAPLLSLAPRRAAYGHLHSVSSSVVNPSRLLFINECSWLLHLIIEVSMILLPGNGF